MDVDFSIQYFKTILNVIFVLTKNIKKMKKNTTQQILLLVFQWVTVLISVTILLLKISFLSVSMSLLMIVFAHVIFRIRMHLNEKQTIEKIEKDYSELNRKKVVKFLKKK